MSASANFRADEAHLVERAIDQLLEGTLGFELANAYASTSAFGARLIVVVEGVGQQRVGFCVHECIIHPK